MDFKKSLQDLESHLNTKEKTLKTLQKCYPQLANLSETQILTYFKVDNILELNEHSKRIKDSIQSNDNLSAHEDNICSCTDSQGQLKDLYNSEASAQEEAKILSRQKRVQLSVYTCPDGWGWHLTKR